MCKGVKKIYDSLQNLMEYWSKICYENNIQSLISACDVAISYYLQQPDMNVEIIKAEHGSFMHCNYKGMPCHRNLDISKIISCHLMDTDDFINFTNILNNNNYFI